jgi:hypothetical protein
MVMRMNADQIRDRRGPFYEHWARQLIMSGHRALVAAREPEA